MTITPSDSLDALIARGPPDATDFAKQIAGLPGAYYAGLDEAYKRRTQDAFQGGVPTTKNAAGQTVPGWDAISTTTIKAGGTPAVDSYVKLSGLQQLQQKIDYANRAETEAAGGVPGAPPSTAPATLPPPPRIPSDGTGQSIAGLVSPGDFGDQTNRVAAAVASKFKVDQTQQLSPQQVSDVQGYISLIPRPPRPQQQQQPPQQQQQPQQQQPQQQQPQPAAPQAPPIFNDRFAPAINGGVASTVPGTVPSSGGGLTPAGRTDQQQLDLLNRQINSGLLDADAVKNKIEQAKAIRANMALTEDAKNYRLVVDQAVKAGQKPPTFEQWKDKDAQNKRETVVLQHSILPMITESQKGATAARNDILAIGRTEEVLNSDKGIISGIKAGDRLALQKIGSYFGLDERQVTNTEAFRSAIGERVRSMIKSFGSGTAISEGDRIYTDKMAGGQIDLNETSIRKILDIGRRAAGDTIRLHNGLVDRTLKASPDLQRFGPAYHVDAPTGRQSAAPTISEGATATNPKTNQRMIYRNGAWAPLGPQT